MNYLLKKFTFLLSNTTKFVKYLEICQISLYLTEIIWWRNDPLPFTRPCLLVKSSRKCSGIDEEELHYYVFWKRFSEPGHQRPGRVGFVGFEGPVRHKRNDQRPMPLHQVWSLTQFYSVDFSQSRIAVNKCVFYKRTSRFASGVVDGVLGPPHLARHTWRCPCISVVPEAMYVSRLKAREGHHASSKSASRVWDWQMGVNGR